MSHRRGRDERRVLRGWRLGWLLLASAPLGLALGACAESTGIQVPPGEIGGGGSDAGPVIPGKCGVGSVACGAGNVGCCASGYKCVAGGCVPAGICMTDADCSGDSTCGGDGCKPWSNYPTGQARNLSCRDAVDLPSLKPEVQCHWPGDTPPSEFPNSVQVIGTPMVVDFDYDDDPTSHSPSIVFVSYENVATQNGVLRVISGRDCRLEATIAGDNPFVREISPALGDVDGDGRPDIVAIDVGPNGASTRMGVAVYGTHGRGIKEFELLSRKNSSQPLTPITGVSIYDVADDNSVPEIITNTGIFAFEDGVKGLSEKSNAVGSVLEPPVVHDVDGDTIPELVTATGIKFWNSATGTLDDRKSRNENLWNTDQSVVAAAFVGMADLGDFETSLGTDSAEMVIVSNGQLLVTQVDGKVLLRVNRDGAAAGPPVIADFDGDGRMEFASPGLDTITAYDLDCVSNNDDVQAKPQNCKNPKGPNPQGILWQQPAHGAQSGASLFDFDGDRRSEIVYADQCYLRIMNGLTGAVLFSVPRSSTTRWDYPVIADVDGDFHSEIVTASNDTSDNACPPVDPLNDSVRFEPSHGVTVWSDKAKRWAGSRMIWNQHAYSVTNVLDDGTIPVIRSVPSQFSSPALDPNTLRQNVQGKTGVSLQLADVTVWVDPVPKCGRNQVATISARLCNRGTLDLDASSVNLSMLQAGGPVCTKGNTSVLRSGGCETIGCDVPVPDKAPGLDIVVLGDSTNAVPECTEGLNNTTLMKNVLCAGVIE